MKKLTLMFVFMSLLLGFICGLPLVADESPPSGNLPKATVAGKSPAPATFPLLDTTNEEKGSSRFEVSFYSGMGAGSIYTAPTFGGSFAYFFKENLGIEIEGGYTLGGDDKVIIPEVISFTVKGPGTFNFLAHLLYDIKKVRKFVFYGKVGAGGVGSSAREVVVNPSSDLFYNVRYDAVKDFALSFGGGFKYQRSSHWAIKVDLKELIVFAEEGTSGIFIALGGLCYSF